MQLAKIVAERIAGQGSSAPNGSSIRTMRGGSGKRARHADALALAARKLIGQAVAVLHAIEPHQVEQFVHPRRNPGLGPAEQLWRDADIAGHTEMRKQPAALEHIADAPPQLDRVEAADVLALDGDRPESASISRLASRNSVVLPEPDLPTMARNSPSATSSETSSTATTPAVPWPAKLLPTCA